VVGQNHLSWSVRRSDDNWMIPIEPKNRVAALVGNELASLRVVSIVPNISCTSMTPI